MAVFWAVVVNKKPWRHLLYDSSVNFGAIRIGRASAASSDIAERMIEGYNHLLSIGIELP